MFYLNNDDGENVHSQLQTARVGPGRDESVLARQNRILLLACVIVLVLLGPLLTAGYLLGRMTAVSVSAAQAPVTSQESAAPKQSAPPRQRSRQPKSSADAISNQSPPHGVYLQLAAVPEHEVLMERLSKNGFHAVALEIPAKPGLYRVLVGPLEKSELAQIRTELENQGLPGNSAIPRVF
jgi:hypothetical protein